MSHTNPEPIALAPRKTQPQTPVSRLLLRVALSESRNRPALCATSLVVELSDTASIHDDHLRAALSCLPSDPLGATGPAAERHLQTAVARSVAAPTRR